MFGTNDKLMEDRSVADLTDNLGHVNGSSDHAGEGDLYSFDWTMDVEQCEQGEEDALKVTDVLPEIRDALAKRKDATRNVRARTAHRLPPRVIPKPSVAVTKKDERIPSEKLKVDVESSQAGSINNVRSSKFYDPLRMKASQQDNQRMSFGRNDTHRRHIRNDFIVDKYSSSNKRLRRPDQRGNDFAAPYGDWNDRNRFVAGKAVHRDIQLTAQSRELEVLKGEYEERIQCLNDRQRSVESRENAVATKLKEITSLKCELDRRSSHFKHTSEVALQRICNERKEHEIFCEQKAREMDQLKVDFQFAMTTQMNAMISQLDSFERDMNQQKRQLDIERVKQESCILARRKELDAREAAQSILQQDLDARLAVCVSGEKQLAKALRDFDATRIAKEAEQKAFSEHLQKMHDDLKSKFDRHEEEVRIWTSAKLKQENDLESRCTEIESVRLLNLSALESQAEAQNRKQAELDSREAALNKRSKELRAMRKEMRGTAGNGQSKATTSSSFHVPTSNNGAVEQAVHETIDYILIDSDDDDQPAGNVRKTSANRPVKSRNIQEPYKTTKESAPQKRKKAGNEPYSYSLSEETAFELQERLFREAAEKMRANATFQVKSVSTSKVDFVISSPILDVAVRHPNHWMWKDPYAVLGLPPQAPMQFVKSQYRKLARMYHPDKSGDSKSSAKFHAISSAYHKLAETTCH